MEPIFHDFSVSAAELIAKEELMPLADAAARLVRNEIVEGMDPGPPRTGRFYKVPGTDTPYQASAPGEPPAIREGLYRDAWQTTPPIDTGDTIKAGVENNFKVGKAGQYNLGELLEEGTTPLVGFSGGLLPRPHIRPALSRVRPKIEALLARWRAKRR